MQRFDSAFQESNIVFFSFFLMNGNPIGSSIADCIVLMAQCSFAVRTQNVAQLNVGRDVAKRAHPVMSRMQSVPGRIGSAICQRSRRNMMAYGAIVGMAHRQMPTDSLLAFNCIHA